VSGALATVHENPGEIVSLRCRAGSNPKTGWWEIWFNISRI
jgi:hypothetical protein